MKSASDILTCLDVRGVTGDLTPFLPAPELRGPGPAGPGGHEPSAPQAVRAILDDVKARGDAALREFTTRFDGVRIDDVRVPAEELKAAADEIPGSLREAMEVARDNIEAFHRIQVHPDRRLDEDGLSLREIRQPVARSGLYIPGGRAPLASTVLMTAVPARVAGVAEVIMCSPPNPDGQMAASVRAAAAIAGVDEVYRVGGAQAVAAMAYGTETIRPVDVIVGPGNRFVALAQRFVAEEGAVGVPSAFAGPSEVAVVADDTTPVEFVAVDLVVQAEHGPDGLAYLITWSDAAATKITETVARITDASPRRADITASLERGGYAVLVDGPEQAMDVANVIAAEHLELMCADAEALVPLVRNAGAVFVGPWAPASVGDYVAGPNHVLPTARSARFGSALRVDDFCKHLHVVSLDQPALQRLAPHVEALASAEGLTVHAESVRVRANSRKGPDGSATSPARAESQGPS